MKKFFFLAVFLLFCCRIADENVKFEGNWWQNTVVSPNGTAFSDSKDSSSNLMVFNSDRTYSSYNQFTGDSMQGMWTIDSSHRILTLYNNTVTFVSNGSVYTNATSSAIVYTNRYDFPDNDKMMIINPSNMSYYRELTRY
jgi:hypothetical protein